MKLATAATSDTNTQMAIKRKIQRRPPVTTLGREQFIDSITLSSTNSVFTLPNNGGVLPSEYWLVGLLLEFRMRATIPASGGPTSLTADCPWSFIQNVKVGGYHVPRAGQEDFINASGPNLMKRARMYYGHAPSALPATISTTAEATNDISMVLPVPFTPLCLPRGEAGLYLVDTPNYRSLKLEIQVADAIAMFTGQSTQPTLSAYGSATGSPICNVHGVYALSGRAGWGNFRPGRMFVYEKKLGNPAVEPNKRLFELPTGFLLRSILLSAGTLKTSTGSNRVFASYSDSDLANVKINHGLGRAVRHFSTAEVAHEQAAHAFGIRTPTGSTLIDFAAPRMGTLNGTLSEAYNTRKLVVGPSELIDFYVSADVDGGSNKAIDMVVEELRYTPVPIG